MQLQVGVCRGDVRGAQPLVIGSAFVPLQRDRLLEFAVLAPGHGNVFTKRDVTRVDAQFFEDLRAEVSAGMRWEEPYEGAILFMEAVMPWGLSRGP